MKIQKPLISVIMPVYNAEKYLYLAIESILNQTFTDFEFIVINDGSTDRSLGIIAEYMKKDKRIVLINKQNSGIVDALNDGLKIANGKFVVRMDSDDIAFKNRIFEELKIFQKNKNIDLVFTDTVLLDKDGNHICSSWKPQKVKKILQNLETINYISHPTVMFKKDIVLKLGGYSKKILHAEDTVLWSNMLENNCKFYYLRKSLLYYRLNPQSVRPGIYNRYWFKVANRCIWNKNKFKAFKYFPKLNIKEKMIILLKMFIPHIIFYYRGSKWNTK